MKRISPRVMVSVGAVLAASALAFTAQDKYSVKVPGGLAFAEFKGYESWQVVSTSDDNGRFAAILGNPVAIKAYQGGIPGNGKPFPDGARIAKVHWVPKQMEAWKTARVPGDQANADFMVKDSKRFAASGGWGYATFEYDAATDTFRPGNSSDKPPQNNDASCGFTCHTAVKARDFVFTDYAHR